MTALQYRAALKRLGLSQLKAARLLATAPRTSQGWALDEYPVCPRAAILLKLMLNGTITVQHIEDAT